VKKCFREVGEPPFRCFALKVTHLHHPQPNDSLINIIQFLSKVKLRKSKDTILDEDGFPCRIDGLEKLYTEIDLMRNLFHRNVSILFEAMDDPEEDSVILVTEYMTGGCVMSFNSVRGRYEYSLSAAAIMGGLGRQKDSGIVEALY
jgi:serine/threonine protein kinase